MSADKATTGLLPAMIQHQDKEDDAVRYARGEIIPDEDDDSHLSDVVAVAQGQTTVAGLRFVTRK